MFVRFSELGKLVRSKLEITGFRIWIAALFFEPIADFEFKRHLKAMLAPVRFARVATRPIRVITIKQDNSFALSASSNHFDQPLNDI